MCWSMELLLRCFMEIAILLVIGSAERDIVSTCPGPVKPNSALQDTHHLCSLNHIPNPAVSSVNMGTCHLQESTKQATWSPPTNPKPRIGFSCALSPTTTLRREPLTFITHFPPPTLLSPPKKLKQKKNTNIILQQDPVIRGGKRMMSYPACHMCAIHWIRWGNVRKRKSSGFEMGRRW